MREAGLRVRSRKRWQLVSSSRDALPIAPNHLDRQFASDRANQPFGHERPRLAVSGRRTRSLFTRCRRLGMHQPCSRPWYAPRWRQPLHADSRKKRGCCTRIHPILRVRLPGLASARSNSAWPFTSGELLGQRHDGELLPFVEGRASVHDARCQLPRSEKRPVRLHPFL